MCLAESSVEVTDVVSSRQHRRWCSGAARNTLMACGRWNRIGCVAEMFYRLVWSGVSWRSHRAVDTVSTPHKHQAYCLVIHIFRILRYCHLQYFMYIKCNERPTHAPTKLFVVRFQSSCLAWNFKSTKFYVFEVMQLTSKYLERIKRPTMQYPWFRCGFSFV